MLDISKLIDVEAGTQSRRIFWDRDVYELELERVFGRCWLFLAHESQIPNANDYVTTKMAEDEVLVWRQADGSTKAFLNLCRHRGTKLCLAEAGTAGALSCMYHGWQYDASGKLTTIPLEKPLYGDNFDKSKLGLRSVPRVESYRGFVFGCMDPDAPSLEAYLGDDKWYMDVWADVPGGIELLGPPGRSIIRSNWKLPTEGFVGDVYHLGMTHGSILKAIGGPVVDFGPGAGMQTTTRYGHGHAIQFGHQNSLLHQIAPQLAKVMQVRKPEDLPPGKSANYGKLYTSFWDGSIFPNCSYLIGLNVFKVWHPIGPDKIEIVTWVIADKRMSDEEKHLMKVAAHRTFGTAGTLEGDDMDNFEFCVRPNQGYFTRQGELNAQMGMGRARIDPEYPGVVSEMVSELSIRGYYRFYADCLASGNWDEINTRSANWKEQLIG